MPEGRTQLAIKLLGASAGAGTSIAVTLPGGLSFNPKAITPAKTCHAPGARPRCRTVSRARGFSLTAGTAISEALSAGRLVIRLGPGEPGLIMAFRPPLILESRSMRQRVVGRQLKRFTVRLRVTTPDHRTTSLSVEAPIFG